MPFRSATQSELQNDFGVVSRGDQDRFRQGLAPTGAPLSEQAAQGPGFLQRVGEAVGERAEKAGEIAEKSMGGAKEQSFLSGVVQTVGQAAGGLADIGEEVAKSAFRALPDPIEEKIRQGAQKATASILETDIGKQGLQAMQQGMEAYERFREANPEAAGNLEAVVNIASIIPAAKGAEVAGRGVQATGRGAIRAAEAGAQVTKEVAEAGAEKVRKVGKAISSDLDPEEALGQILQGKQKDLTSGQRALNVIDTTDVETFGDLEKKLDESISTLSKQVDEALGEDVEIKRLDELTTKRTTRGGKTVETNFVEKSLNDLEEMYTKIGDDVKAEEIRELVEKATEEGLTRKEINDLSREYGSTFGRKAFGKTGEPLTSVNAQAFENTRKGIKDVARKGIAGDEAKRLDELLSDTFSTRDLIEKNKDAANKLSQKVEKMGLGKKAVREIIGLVDRLSLGGTKALRESFIQSNIGRKSMNALDIEDSLKKNLEIIRKAQGEKDPGKIKSILNKILKIKDTSSKKNNAPVSAKEKTKTILDQSS